jgi:hypothetical protein
MRFTVQYIPLDKIKPGTAGKLSQRVKALQQMAWDSMHLLIVQKNRKGGTYTILTGCDRYDYLRKHTKRTHAPCLVDAQRSLLRLPSWLPRLPKRKLPYPVPSVQPSRIQDGSWSIIRTFMKQEPRFRSLSRRQQLQVLLLGIRYKRTTIRSMKSKVDDILKPM